MEAVLLDNPSIRHVAFENGIEVKESIHVGNLADGRLLFLQHDKYGKIIGVEITIPPKMFSFAQDSDD